MLLLLLLVALLLLFRCGDTVLRRFHPRLSDPLVVQLQLGEKIGRVG